MRSWGQHGEILFFFGKGMLVQHNLCNVSQALLTMASPEEALRALAVMHNYAPEEYKVCLGEGNISISLSVLI